MLSYYSTHLKPLSGGGSSQDPLESTPMRIDLDLGTLLRIVTIVVEESKPYDLWNVRSRSLLISLMLE